MAISESLVITLETEFVFNYWAELFNSSQKQGFPKVTLEYLNNVISNVIEEKGEIISGGRQSYRKRK